MRPDFRPGLLLGEGVGDGGGGGGVDSLIPPCYDRAAAQGGSGTVQFGWHSTLEVTVDPNLRITD